MTKMLSKAVMQRVPLRYIFWKDSADENKNVFNKSRKLSLSL